MESHRRSRSPQLSHLVVGEMINNNNNNIFTPFNNASKLSSSSASSTSTAIHSTSSSISNFNWNALQVTRLNSSSTNNNYNTNTNNTNNTNNLMNLSPSLKSIGASTTASGEISPVEFSLSPQRVENNTNILSDHQQTQKQERKEEEEEEEEISLNLLSSSSSSSSSSVSFPLNRRPDRFRNIKFLTEGGYGKIFSATDILRLQNDGRDLDVAVKVMDFSCSVLEARRAETLSNYGDLEILLPGQEYCPVHVAAELRAHVALKEVDGTMPLRRVDIWCDFSEEEESEAEEVKVYVMLVLPMLTPIQSDFFSKSSSSFLDEEEDFLPTSSPSTENNNNNNNVPDLVLKSSILNLASTLQQMHSRSWLHRDLSVSNCFFDNKTNSLVLGDFGLACCVARHGRQSSCHMMQHYSSCSSGASACTTIWYRSPEILLNPDTKNFSFEQDAWSLGAVVAELCLGTPIFDGMESQEQIQKIQKALLDETSSSSTSTSFFDDLLLKKNETTNNNEISEKIVRAAQQHLLRFDENERSISKFIKCLEQF